MRWRAAFVPLAAVTAATLLFSTAAWGQATEVEPSPDPSVVETSDAEPSDPEVASTPDPIEVDTDAALEEPATPARVQKETQRTSKVQGGAPLPQVVTFYASPKVVKVGKNVEVWGKVSPALNGDRVKIVNAATGYKIKSIKIKGDGTYEGLVRVRKNVPLQARYEAVRSKWRHIKATPNLKVRMSTARLFGRVKVRGHINPVTAGKRVRLKLYQDGRLTGRRGARINKRGVFKKKFRVAEAGTHRAVAVFKSDDWRTVRDKSARSTTPLPTLSEGSRGIYVKLLEKRLGQLRHHLAGRNSYFGQDTADAVMAFNKVNRRARVSYVTADTWHALANQNRPKARFDSPGFHIEVNQTKQVLYVVRDGKVTGILHVSTGAPSTPTYDGTYQFWGKLAGYSPNRLYYPSYFHGERAIHGWPSVPAYNASHGCVRVPMWAAQWIYGKTEIGDTIRVYH